MGSAVKKAAPSVILWVALAAIAIAAGIYYFSTREAPAEKALLTTPPPRPGSPDFGPLPPENIIGGPSSPNLKTPGK